MSKIQQDFVVKAGTGNPDPATYCPSNGFVDQTIVIPNPLLPSDGWFLIASFQNNSPNTLMFDPSFTASSGDYAWDLGDGTVIKNTIASKNISYQYATTATRTVKLYGKGTCAISTIDMNTDNIVGVLDLRHDAFKTCNSFAVYSNPLNTSVLLPPVMSVSLVVFLAYSNNITGTIDLSMLSSLSTANIQLQSNPLLSGISLPAIVTGTLGTFRLENTGYTGVLDFRMFKDYTVGANIYIDTNNSMTGILLPALTTGSLTTLSIYNNPNLTGTIDISGYRNWSSTTTTALSIYTMPLVTSITLPSTVTGSLAGLLIYNVGHIGTLDLSVFTAFNTTNTQIGVYSNPAMTSLKFANTITGTINVLDVFLNPLIPNLDISMFKTFSVSARIWAYNNTACSSVITPSSAVTGTLNQLQFFSNNITGVLDLSKYTNMTATCDIQVQTNPLLTNLILPTAITGTISKLYCFNTGIAGVLDLSKLTTFIATGADVQINTNPSMTGVTFSPTTITGFIKTLSLFGCPNLGYVDLTKLKTGIASLSWNFSGNSWTKAIVNQTLAQLDTMSASGFAGRSINVSGNNAWPDQTAGGYDGITAKANLVTKTFTVTISTSVPILDVTNAATAIAQTTATSGGNVNDLGGSLLIAKGVCWALSPTVPTTANSKTSNGAGLGSFVSNLTALTANKTYIVRSYATNTTGTGYGAQISFTTSP